MEAEGSGLGWGSDTDPGSGDQGCGEELVKVSVKADRAWRLGGRHSDTGWNQTGCHPSLWRLRVGSWECIIFFPLYVFLYIVSMSIAFCFVLSEDKPSFTFRTSTLPPASFLGSLLQEVCPWPSPLPTDFYP